MKLSGYDPDSIKLPTLIDVPTDLTIPHLASLMEETLIPEYDIEYPVNQPLREYLQGIGVNLEEGLQWEFEMAFPDRAVTPRSSRTPKNE